MAKVPQPTDFIDGHQMPSGDMLEAIGRLAIITASIEDILHELTWKYLKVPRHVGALLTNEKKLKRLTQDLIKMCKTTKATSLILEDFEDIFVDLEGTAFVRNQCIHWIWEQPKTGVHRLHPPAYMRNKTSVKFSVSDVNKIGDELIWIEYRLRSHAMTIVELYREIRKEGIEYVPAPWLYILPQSE